MNVQNGLGAGQSDSIGGPWGPQGSGDGKRSYSSIASISTIRDNKNVLEVRLEKQEGATFRLSQLEIELRPI